MTTIPGPPPAPTPQYATQMSARRPRLKYHTNRGHAMNAVLSKVYGHGGTLWQDVTAYRRNDAGEYEEIASWKRGDRVTQDEVREKFCKI